MAGLSFTDCGLRQKDRAGWLANPPQHLQHRVIAARPDGTALSQDNTESET